MRYLFPISGHMEVMAETEEQAAAKIKDKYITHYDKDSKIFVFVVPASYKSIHSEEG